ncbi:MAG TPA: RNA polymerase sigma factor [Candidatus Binatia bacterium]|nr:RNA polymerase sigma factor [Candidatus Binatia bacterium]
MSFAEFAERHRPEILRYLVRLLGNEADAQDACQDVFLRAQPAFVRLAPGSNSRAWLYRIATNNALNAKRQRARLAARDVHVDLDTLSAVDAGEPRDELRALRRAVTALPARQRAALMLRQFHDMSYAEIAASVGGNEGTARANVYQALKKLRAALGGEQ